MIVADTNVVSELMKGEPNSHVLAWAGTLGPGDVAISVVTVEEIERGLARLPRGHRRAWLEKQWTVLAKRFEALTLAYDASAARATALINEQAPAAGQPMSLADSQVAGICISAGATLATRNTKDFEHVAQLEIMNPFA